MTHDIPNEIYRLAESINKLNKERQKLGLFIDDRELLKCEICGLAEDVTFDSRLITYIISDGKDEIKPVDNGLRFITTDMQTIYLCPICGNEVKLKEFGIGNE